MKIAFNTITAVLPSQGKKSDKSLSAIQPLVDRFAEGLRTLAASAFEANPVTLDQVKQALLSANAQSSKKISELPLAIKPIVVSALVDQALEAGIADFTNDHAIEVLKFPKNIMPVVNSLPETILLVEPAAKKEKPPVQRAYITVENRMRDSVLNSFNYVFREGIDSEYLDGVCKGPELEVGKNYAIVVLSENGTQAASNSPLRNHVEFYGKKDSSLRFKTLDSSPLRTLGRHIAFIKVDVKSPSYLPEDEKQRRGSLGQAEYVPDPEVLAIINRKRYSRVFH